MSWCLACTAVSSITDNLPGTILPYYDRKMTIDEIFNPNISRTLTMFMYSCFGIP